MGADKKTTRYTAKQADAQGFVDYTDTENDTWAQLYERQIDAIRERACQEYLNGLKLLDLPTDRVAQIPEVNKTLLATTGWQLEPAAAIIPFEEFFELLANRKFPAATFIRKQEDLDYLQEPDIFHEIFGHCPMLTDPDFSRFLHKYGQLGLQATNQARVYLARLFWFTIEFGLIKTNQGLRIYGAGILSSLQETKHALRAESVEHRPFETKTVLRTPYRIDHLQPIYYVINQFEELSDVLEGNVFMQIKEAREMGLFNREDLSRESSITHAC